MFGRPKLYNMCFVVFTVEGAVFFGSKWGTTHHLRNDSSCGLTLLFFNSAKILIGVGMGIFASPNRASIMNPCFTQHKRPSIGYKHEARNVGNTFNLGLAFPIITSCTHARELEEIFLGASTLGHAPLISRFASSNHRVFIVSSIMLLVGIIPSALCGKTDTKNI